MYYIPMGMLNGADVSAARYNAQSLVPSFIGNCELRPPRLCEVTS